MDSMPCGVVQRICDALADDHAASASYSSSNALAPYATISRRWQRAVERHTFRTLYLSSERLEDLATIVGAHEHRQAHVRVITLHVALAAYDRRQGKDKESEEDGSRATRVFTSTIQEFFQILSPWNDGGEREDATRGIHGIHLELLVESPSDESRGSRSRRSRSPPTTRRARASVAHLEVPRRDLPRVSMVTALTCSGRHIETSSMLLLVSKLPNLQVLDTEIEHDTSGVRDVEQRKEFVMGLEHYAAHLSELRLRRPMNLYESPKARSKEARALFYSVLLRYSQRCTSLTFDDCIDARELLGPFRGDTYPDSNYARWWWPHLRRLHLRNSYMMRRPYMRVGHRSVALRHVHETLLLVGRAVRCMPWMENMRLRQYILTGGELEQFVVQYEVTTDGSSGEVVTARVDVHGLEPLQSTMEVWKQNVRATRNVELDIRVHLDSSHDVERSAP